MQTKLYLFKNIISFQDLYRKKNVLFFLCINIKIIIKYYTLYSLFLREKTREN